MKKRVTEITFLTAIIILAGTGCTHIIKYDLKEVRMARPDSRRQEMRVAVAPLQDTRPEYEKNPPIFTSRSKTETRDKMFKNGDVAMGMSEALVAHFNHVQLFKISEIVDKSASVPSEEVLTKMKSLGYDLLFTGQVRHFYGAGYPTVFDKVAIGLAVIPVTAIVTIPIILIEQNENEGYVEIIDVRLTDTISGEVLWSGSFSKKINVKYSDTYPARAACETLREVGNEIVNQIESAKIN